MEAGPWIDARVSEKPGPLANEPELKALKFGEGFPAFEALDAAYPQLSEVPAIAEMRNAPKTFVHIRGDFRNPGVEVQPDTPAVLPPLPPKSKQRSPGSCAVAGVA